MLYIYICIPIVEKVGYFRGAYFTPTLNIYIYIYTHSDICVDKVFLLGVGGTRCFFLIFFFFFFLKIYIYIYI